MSEGHSPGAMSATGAAGGFFSGLTGVGGGAIMVPLMTGVLKMQQHAAHGTSLFIIIFAAAAGAATYGFTEGIDALLVAELLGGSMVGAYAGARAVQALPAMRLRQAFGLFLLAIGLRMVLIHDVEPMLNVSGASEALAGAGIGLAGGLFAGALGVGGGAIFVPGTVILLGTSQHEAQAASLVVIVLTAIVGAWTHYRHGTLDLSAARWITPAAVPAGVLGAFAASTLDASLLQRIFAGVVLAVGTQMLFTASRRIRAERGLAGAVAEGQVA